MKTPALLLTSLLALLGFSSAARAAAPSVKTTNPTSITTNSATLNGSANPNGLATTAYFEWGTTTNYGFTTAGQVIGSGSSAVLVSANLPSLLTDTNYHYRLVASNSAGITYGTDVIVTPTLLLYLYAGESWSYVFSELPSLTTVAAGSQYAACSLGVLAGSFPAGSTLRFELFANSTNEAAVSSTLVTPTGGASVTLTGSMVWRNDGQGAVRLTMLTGSVAISSILFEQAVFFPPFLSLDYFNLITPTKHPQPPSFGTQFVSSVTHHSAQVNVDIDVNNLDSGVFVQWGTTTNYGSVTSPLLLNQDRVVAQQITVSNLAAATGYFVRIFVTNSLGTHFGNELSLTTSSLLPPVAQTLPASNVTPSSATLNGSVALQGSPASAYFEWGLTASYGNKTPVSSLAAGTNAVNVQAALTGLAAATTYHFRMVATNDLGATAGSDQTFTTGCAPGGGTATVLNNTEAELRAAISSAGTVTFASDGVITLANPLVISCSLKLDASGRLVTLSGGNSNRIFEVRPGGSLELINLTIANGRVVGTNANHGGLAGGLFGLAGQSVEGGGVLLSNASFSARNCVFTNCTLQGGTGGNFSSPGAGGAALGGVIFAHSTPVLVSNCLFIGNSVTAGNSGTGNFVNDPTPTLGTGHGGAIYVSSGLLIATNCQFNGNSANTSGGAININTSGSGTLNQCAFSGNFAGISGGAVAFSGSGLGVRRSTFRNNAAAGTYSYSAISGGAMVVSAGTITIRDSDFANNQCFGTPARGTPSGAVSGTSGNGGALAHVGGNSTITGCAFRENAVYGGNGAVGTPFSGSPALAQGGAVWCSGGSIEMLNCTLAHNSVRPGFLGANSAAGGGGAIAATGGLLVLGSCTIASNRVSNAAAGLAVGGGIVLSSSSMDLGNCLLQGNSVNASSSSNYYGNGLIDYGHNLSSDGTPALSAEGSLNNTDARLLPTADNGGPSLTMALRPGSPALNFADPEAFPATDQRGVARPQGPGPDVGAWEGAGGPVNLRIVHQTFFPQLNTLTWLSDTGVTYRVERAGTVNNWSVLATNIPGNGATVLHIITNTGAAYFRVAIEP